MAVLGVAPTSGHEPAAMLTCTPRGGIALTSSAGTVLLHVKHTGPAGEMRLFFSMSAGVRGGLQVHQQVTARDPRRPPAVDTLRSSAHWFRRTFPVKQPIQCPCLHLRGVGGRDDVCADPTGRLPHSGVRNRRRRARGHTVRLEASLGAA